MLKVEKASKKMRKSIAVNGKFVAIGKGSLDAKWRVSLGRCVKKSSNKLANVDSFHIFVDREGDILLRPEVLIPSNEAWIYRNPEVIARIRKGLDEAARGETQKVEDLDEFFETL